MKILAIGDFHGKFPEKLWKEAKRKGIDFVISPGDFANSDKIRKAVFKYWTAANWYEAIGLKKAKQLRKESFDSGLKILKKLNSLGKKVYLVWGNCDFYKDVRESTSGIPKSIVPGEYENKIKKFKNIILIDNKKRRVKGIEVIGHGKYLDVTEFIKNPIDKDKKKQQERLRRYRKDEKRLKKLFLNKNPRENFIFLTHYTPYKIFDKVDFKKSPMHGKHLGWLPYNNIIKHYKPMLVICGHMHEYQGKQRLGKSLIINPGAAQDGKAAIIEIDDINKKVKSMRFLR